MKKPQKKITEKNIEIEFEKRIQDAINNLKDLSSNFDDENKAIKKIIKNKKDKNNINNRLFLDNNNNEVIFNEKNIKNTNIISPQMINSDTEFLRKYSENKPNKEQNFITYFKESHYIPFQSLFLPHDLQHLDQFNLENKNESKIDDFGGMTRPESYVNLCNGENTPEDVYLKPEDLESIDEGKEIHKNFFVNENYIINMPINYNYIFMGDPPNLLSGNKILNFNID